MSDDPELAAVRARHEPYARDPDVVRGDDDPKWCDCGDPWPCDTFMTLQSVGRLREGLTALIIACRDAGVCIFCHTGRSQEHDAGCEVQAAVDVLYPRSLAPREAI